MNAKPFAATRVSCVAGVGLRSGQSCRGPVLRLPDRASPFQCPFHALMRVSHVLHRNHSPALDATLADPKLVNFGRGDVTYFMPSNQLSIQTKSNLHERLHGTELEHARGHLLRMNHYRAKSLKVLTAEVTRRDPSRAAHGTGINL